ncbi:MAG TPA: hypothetical protein VN258_10865 [Mobilitalea sp.]|nr:hypothetical protein [Mobilitalea sp.]
MTSSIFILPVGRVTSDQAVRYIHPVTPLSVSILTQFLLSVAVSQITSPPLTATEDDLKLGFKIISDSAPGNWYYIRWYHLDKDNTYH